MIKYCVECKQCHNDKCFVNNMDEKDLKLCKCKGE